MDFGLTVEETKDKDLILGVLTHPEIYSCIIDDSCPNSDEFDIDVDDGHFLIGFDGQRNVVGLMAFHNANNWNCHIQVIPKYRKLFAKMFANQCFNWFFDKYKTDLFAEIPGKYPNVSRFAERLGFEYRETPKESCKINDIVYNIDTYQLRYSSWAS